MSDEWTNHGYEIYRRETGKERTGTFARAASVTSDVIKRASLQWYKMKWQFTASADDLWGEEVQGYSTVVNNSPLSDHVMFKDGKITPIRLRFFNLTQGDDASNDIRGAFLKFADKGEEGPFDIGFSTGDVACFDDVSSQQQFLSALDGDADTLRDWALMTPGNTGNVACFDDVSSQQQFLSALDGDADTLRDWALMTPGNYHALVESVRRCPKCWSDLDYYSHVTYSMTQSGREVMVRFRLKGHDDISSRLNKQEQEEAWILGRPDMELPSDTYLHRKLRDVATNNITMKLQVQVRDIRDTDEIVLSPIYCWDETPWVDLADILCTYNIPKLQGERSRHDFTKTPDGIRINTAGGSDNLGRLIHIQEKVLTSTVRKKHPEPIIEYSGRNTTYLMHVETGSYMFSGTDASVHVALFGTKGRTRKLLLDKIFHDDFERGSKEAYYVTVPVIGDIQFVNVFLLGGKYTISRDWFLSNIVIFDLSTRKLFEIPCYRWISDRLDLPTGTAVLPQNETDKSRKFLRHLYIEDQKDLVTWGTIPGLPGKIGSSTYEEIPMDLKFPSERDWYKKFVIYDVLAKLKLHQYTTAMHSFDSLDEFRSMCDVIPNSETLRLMLEDDTWKTDEEFGRTYLAGICPTTVRRLDKKLDNFPVTHAMVGKFLDRGMSLEQEIKEGHIYYVDYPYFDGIKLKSGEDPRYVTSPLVMFYVRSSGDFVPIAIQLKDVPAADNPIFTPDDSEMDWLIAKCFVKSADVHLQTLYHHVTRAHLFMEALSIALLRQFPPNHPVYKILLPHTRNAIATAQKGRDKLLDGEDSILQQVLAFEGDIVKFICNAYKRFHYNELVLPKDLQSRGVDDKDKLPMYPYRDDALLHWKAIYDYSSKLITSFYKIDVDVVKDFELQAFITDVHVNGFPSTGEVPNGVPDKLTTIDDLTEFVTMFVFNSSVYHAAVNYGQLDYISFGPIYPSGLRLPPPTTKGEGTLERFIHTLPNKSSQSLSMAFAYFLSAELHDEIYLGDFPDALFVEPEIRETLLWFADEQDKISAKIKDRNTYLKIPYTYLLPEKIPNSAGQ